MRVRLFGVVAVTVVGVGCATLGPRGLTAPAPLPAGPATPARLVAPAGRGATAVTVPPRLVEPGLTLALAEVVAVALENNPQTRAAYHQARAAAAQLAAKRAAYYPSADLAAALTRQSATAFGGNPGGPWTSYGPTVSLEYLLFDLGGRAANAEEARLALEAADWAHDATVQNVVLEVERSFVAYLSAKARLAAARDAVAHARTALEAATVRHDAGVATIADVLQAQTALSQALLEEQQWSGEVMVVRGALATAMGLPATTPYDVGDLPAELPLDQAEAAVETLIAQAQAARPELAVARLAAAKAAAHVEAVRAEGLPRVVLSASAGRTYLDPALDASREDTWSARLLLRVPLFTGFEQRANVAKASEEAAVAAAQVEAVEQRLILEVWSSAYALKTASQLVATSRDLVASAEQSEAVAMGRYREGVGTILDLLAAQTALSRARAAEIAARSGWYLALAQLAHDTGAASPLLAAAVAVESEGER